MNELQIPVIDFRMIFVLGVIYAIIDYLIFKFIGIKRFTLILSLIPNVIIPCLYIIWLPHSGLPFFEQTLIFLKNWMFTGENVERY